MNLFGRHPRQDEQTWDNAPPWAIELGAMILYTWEQQMAAIDDLKTAVTNLATEVAAVSNAIDAKPPSVSEADLQTVVAQINPLVDTLKSVVTKITG
jgi:hypothetical protein